MGDPPTTTATEPLAERVVSDVETLKALSDPLRIRVLEAMSARYRESWTVKRLAAELGVGTTKLYHHVNLLEERGLIRVAGTRVVSGIIETSYQVAQLSLRLDRRLLAGGSVPEPVDELLRTVLDGVRLGITNSIRSGIVDLGPDVAAPRRLLLARGLVRVPEARAGELHDRLRAVVDEFDAMSDDDEGVTFGYLLGLYPIATPTGTEGDNR